MAERTQQDGATRRTQPLRATIVGTVASVVRWAGLVVVVILVIRVLLTVGGANQANGISSFITSWSDPLAWGFKDLFTPSDAKLRVLENYGVAALFWLIVSSVLSRMIRRFA